MAMTTAMASSSLVNPHATKPALHQAAAAAPLAPAAAAGGARRRELALSLAAGLPLLVLQAAVPWMAAAAEENEEYVRETSEVIGKVRSTLTLQKGDPEVAAAVAELREASNSWVAKYRREKTLLGRASFRDMYSALNAVSGHFVNFGPTAPLPAKRKARILEELDTAEKALLRGR